MQCMLVDALEVEDNLRMSKKLLDQGGDDKMEKDLRLNEQCVGDELASLSDVFWYGREKDQINDVQGGDCNPLFYENCNHLVVHLVADNFEKDFKFPVYDEYKEDFWMLCLKNLW